jgi:MFS family permease
VFVFGLLLFSGASLLGGFATSQWWLLTARAIQGAGGAVIAPTALALITTNFPQGGERNRAFSVYAAMAGAGTDSIRTQVAHAAAAAAKAGRPLPKPGTPTPASIYDHALTVGFSSGFVVAAGIALLALLIGIVTIRVSRQELAGAVPAPQEAASQSPAQQPGTVQRHEDRAALAAAVRPCRLC